MYAELFRDSYKYDLLRFVLELSHGQKLQPAKMLHPRIRFSAGICFVYRIARTSISIDHLTRN
jgi:hypothetical protein